MFRQEPKEFESLPQDIRERLAEHFQTSLKWRRIRAVANLRSAALVISIAIAQISAFGAMAWLCFELAAMPSLLMRTVIVSMLLYAASITAYFSRNPSGKNWTYSAGLGLLGVGLICAFSLIEYIAKPTGNMVVVFVLAYGAFFVYPPFLSWHRANDDLCAAEQVNSREI